MELLVVLMLIGLTIGLVVAKLEKSDSQTLQLEAHRLALLLAHAQTVARTSGSVIVWRPTVKNYTFLQQSPPTQGSLDSANTLWTPIVSDPILRPRNWPEDTVLHDLRINGQRAETESRLLFSPSGFNEEFTITLKRQNAKVIIRGNVLGQVEDEPVQEASEVSSLALLKP